MATAAKQSRNKGYIIDGLELTPGEVLKLWRKRKKLTQEEAAAFFNTTFSIYQLAEYDKTDNFIYPPTLISNLEPHEKCRIYRTRRGWTQKQVAKKMKISRNWFRELETGKIDCSRLMDWWEKLKN